MIINFRKTAIVLLSSLFVLFLSSCKNPFLANADGKYQVSFVTNCETKIDSYRTDKIEAIQELTKEDYVFGGWYTSAAFDGEPIKFPYKITQDITLYAKWIEIPTVTFETNCETKIGSYRTDKIVSIQELTRENYEFDGWYTSGSFEGESITFPYKVTQNITLYAKWIDKSKIITFEGCNTTSDFVTLCNSYDNVEYTDGLLTIGSKYEKIILKNSQSTDLRIKLSNPHAKVVFDKIIFSSSKGSMVESFSDILIEYYGNNELSSSASTALSLIKSFGTVEFRGKNNGSLKLLTNTVTNLNDDFSGSIGVKANKVIIDGGNFVIKGSDGWNNTITGNAGGEGSSGIEALETIIRNNAVVTIEAGNGANGNNGYDGSSGYDQPENNSNLLGKRAPDGTDGTSGGSGGNGGSGGSAIKGKLIAEVCKITLTGGKGGNGGNGGNGGRGGNGSHNSTNWEIFHWCCGGGNGGNGGKGGDGGTGGNGGDAITGSYSGNNCSANLAGGKKGSAGNGGTGGAAGSEGGAGWGCGDSGNSGSKGTNGASGNPGKDGVEHR